MLAGQKRFEGWWVVGSVFLLLMTNAGLGFYGLAVYLDAITDEQGFSTWSVSLATSVFFAVSGITGRVIAPVIETRDVRQVVALGGVVAAIGMWLIGQVDSLWTMYPSYIVFAIGAALTGLVPGTTLVTRWFHAKRSVAVSVASTGLSVGGLTITVVASRLVDTKGMADAAPWLALMYVALVAVSLVTMWPTPESRGTVPDGEAPSGTEQPAALAGVSYEEARQSRFFVCVTAGFVFCMAAQVGGIAQLAKLGTERIDRPAGVMAVSAVALASVVARLIGGVVASRVAMVPMTAVLAAVQSLALLLLAFADSQVMLVASALLFGGTVGNLLMLQPLLVADHFGVAHYPRIFALEQLIVMTGVAGGPFLLGALRDLLSYRASYVAAAMLSLLGAAIIAQAERAPRLSTATVGQVA